MAEQQKRTLIGIDFATCIKSIADGHVTPDEVDCIYAGDDFLVYKGLSPTITESFLLPFKDMWVLGTKPKLLDERYKYVVGIASKLINAGKVIRESPLQAAPSLPRDIAKDCWLDKETKEPVNVFAIQKPDPPPAQLPPNSPPKPPKPAKAKKPLTLPVIPKPAAKLAVPPAFPVKEMAPVRPSEKRRQEASFVRPPIPLHANNPYLVQFYKLISVSPESFIKSVRTAQENLMNVMLSAQESGSDPKSIPAAKQLLVTAYEAMARHIVLSNNQTPILAAEKDAENMLNAIQEVRSRNKTPAPAPAASTHHL